MPPIRQTNFSAGELAPSMWGRTDLEKYANGLRTMRNFFASRQGAAVSRAGTHFIASAKTSDEHRLIPFIYSDSISYVLELGENYIRVFTAGAAVLLSKLNYTTLTTPFTVGDVVTGATSASTGIILSDNGSTLVLYNVDNPNVPFLDGENLSDPDGGAAVADGALYAGNPYEVVTTYAAADLPRLQFSQTGDIITLTHPSYEPMELKRHASDYWTLTAVNFEHVASYFKDVATPYAATLEPFLMAKYAKWLASTSYAVGDKVSNSVGDPYQCITLGTSAASGGPTGEAADITDGTAHWTYLEEDISHPRREWKWKTSAVAQDTATGVIFETLPVDVVNSLPKDAVTIGSSPLHPIRTDSIALSADRPLTLRRPETSGLIGTPAGWDSYKVLAYNYYRGRGDLFGFVGQTKTRDFVDVGAEPDYGTQPPLGTNPFKVFDTDGNLVRTERPAATTFFQERRCFAGTTERPGFLFASATGDYTNFDVRTILVAGDAVSFDLLTRTRQDIRSLLPLTRLVVFTNASVWSIAGQQGTALDFKSVDAKVIEAIGASYLQPIEVDGAALYVRTKGVGVRALAAANSLSGFEGQDLSIISQHLFLGETRSAGTVARYILGSERTREIVDWCYAEDPWGLVWAVRADGVLLSLTYSQSDKVWAWARHETDGEVLRVCSVPEGDEDAVYLLVKRVVNSVTHYYLERMASRVRKGSPDDDAAVDCALTYTGPPTKTLTGLTHLEGKSVYAVCAGNAPQGPYTVTDGAITLGELPTAIFQTEVDEEPAQYVAVHVGLLYTADLETLDIAASSVRMKQKNVTAVGFEVEGSIGLEAGPNFDNLKPWRQRQVSDSYDAISAATELVRVPVSGTWSRSGRAVLRQTLPLPTTVLGVTREVDLGD